jgi:MAC/Perforin domain
MSKQPVKLNLDNLTDKDLAVLDTFAATTPVGAPVTPDPPIIRGAKPSVDDPKDRPLKKPFKADLTFLDLPPHRRATDTTEEITGFGRSTTNSRRDVLSKLTVGDEILLLAENNIHLSAKPPKEKKDPIGSMHGYRMVGNTLDMSDHSVVRFRGLKLLAENVGRVDNYSYTYHEFSSGLHKNLYFGGHLGAGVPDIFEFSTSASHKAGLLEHSETVEVHFQASQQVPKARVIFKKEDISLDDEFVDSVEAACKKDDVQGLLRLLERNGQFVPLSIVLGGRIVLSTTKKLNSKSEFDAAKTELQAAASGRYVYDGVTVKGDAGVAGGTREERERNLTAQMKALHMEVIGGDERESTSDTDKLGTHWIDTVGPFFGWKTIGFEPKSLVPIIDFLPRDIAETCRAMLRKYFSKHLNAAYSVTAGHATGKKFERDIKGVQRLRNFIVNREGNIDGMKLNYEVYAPGGFSVVQDKVGKDRGNSYDVTVPPFNKEFNPGEAIVTINARVDSKADKGTGSLKQIQFITNDGNKYPGDKDFYGKNKWDTEVEITAPRVRGIYGYTGAYVHCIGLMYLQLAKSVSSRDYLLAMEPYLFPTQQY